MRKKYYKYTIFDKTFPQRKMKMMFVTLSVLLTLVTNTVYGLESTREHFLNWLQSPIIQGHKPTGKLEDRVARLEKVFSEGMQKLQNELDQQKARNDILQTLLEKQDTKLKDQEASIKELLESNVKLRETASIQTGKIQQLEEYARTCRKANVSVNDGGFETFRNATTSQVTERSNLSRDQIRDENKSRVVTPYVINEDLAMNAIIKKQIPLNQVAFYVTVSRPDLINLGEHHPIVFDDVVTNVGGAYHRSTGIFTAPIHGIYFFSVTAMVLPGIYGALDLVKDGEIICDFVADSGNANHLVSVTRTLLLEVLQGSEIWVRTRTSEQIHGNRHTTLSGFLLIQM